LLVDVRAVPPAKRAAAAERIRTASDFTLPELTFFNTDPCPAHDSIAAGAAAIPPCRACGVALRKHQRVGVAWLYTRGRGLIADQTGTGKTAQAAGLLAAIKQNGELDERRALVVCRPAALPQWQEQLHRFIPKLHTITATGTRRARVDTYLTSWDVLIIGYQMLVGDVDKLLNFPLAALIVDDVDPLRNRANRTAQALKRIARRCERAAVLTATPMHKKLHELHSVLELIGGLEVFGSQSAFIRRYVREETVRIYNARAGRMVNTRNTVGYKNLDEFIRLVTPMTLRRTPADIDDTDLPAIIPHTIDLDLHPVQRDRYDTLRAGVLKIIKAEGASVKRATAAARFTYGAQICAGLPALGEADGPGASVKLDWVENALTGDLAEEKVVVFSQFIGVAQALMQRLTRHGIGHAVIWGRDINKDNRTQARRRFWDDPDCRVLIGTAAIEQSLDLQVARHLINIDQLLNPARMHQLAGRISRAGSAYRSVYVHNLLTRDTQEAGYMDILRREQALTDHLWGESNQLYEALDSLSLLQLIGTCGGKAPRR
jgi:SNF2 family DNA or RNA helicase